MDAKHINVLSFIRSASQLVIPIYQRKYSWDRSQCEQLWHDILRVGSEEGVGGHFIGSVVYVTDTDAHNAPLLVIDGQQRLATLTLLISALRIAVGDKEILGDFSGEKLESYYLVNPFEKGDMRRKLMLSKDDRETLFAIVDGRDVPDDCAHRLQANFSYFKKKCLERDVDLEIVCRGLAKLLIVYVALSRKDDNPQLIFESMNSTGRKLTQSDLIRNFVLMGLEPELQENLYNYYWRPMEKSFGESHDKFFDRFMRDYLTLKMGVIPNIGDVYTTFKHFALSKSVESLVEDVSLFSRYYCRMAFGQEEDKELKDVFYDFSTLKVDVAYPLLLEFYADYQEGKLSHQDFKQAVRLIESYVFRRNVCAIPTVSMSKTFARFGRDLNKEKYLESIRVHFLKLSSYRRFPSDDEFKDQMKNRDLYHIKLRTYWLRRLENDDRKEYVPVNEYTIEHIMPQTLTNEWKSSLGEEWEHIHTHYLHTLGNLTLTGYNSEYSNRSFREKRDREGGLGSSPLKVNEGLGEIEEWSEASILRRAEKLASKACDVWSAPYLPPEVWASYQEEKKEEAIYSEEDHPALQNSPTKELFAAFRREALNLDDCVSEEFFKRYIAYKAETNFVDVEPRKSELKLYLHMDWVDVEDSKGMCRDVSEVGKWSSGDVEVKLGRMEDLSYVMGLVRQSLDRQLGGDSGE